MDPTTPKFHFSKRSLDNLAGLHPDIQAIFHEALRITDIDFVVIEGLRTVERQRELFNQRPRVTTTMKSRHLDGFAADACPYPIDWDDIAKFVQLSEIIKQAAVNLGLKIQWGGDWSGFPDSPHWQLSHQAYPSAAGYKSRMPTPDPIVVAAANVDAPPEPSKLKTIMRRLAFGW